LVIINGQHQIDACIKSNKSIKVCYCVYACENENDVMDAFSTFNVDKVRSQGDLVKAKMEAMGLKWNQTIASALVSAEDNIDENNKYKSRNKSLTKHEKVQLLEDIIEPGQIIVDLIQEYKPKRKFKTVNVFIGMLMTYYANSTHFVDFWKGVYTGANLVDGDARLLLRDFILNTSSSKNTKDPEIVMMFKIQYIATIILLWNRYRKNETSNRLPKIKKDKDYFPTAI
jgi:hypothetical protein